MSAAAAIIIMNRQKELVDRFCNASATSPDTARTLDELRVGDRGLIFRRLAQRGVFVQAAGDRWYFDAKAWDRYRDRQWSRLVWGAAVILGLSVALLLFLSLR